MAIKPTLQPAEPLVKKNPFRQRSFDDRTPPPFADVKNRLPQPALPQHPGWVEMYWRAWEMAWNHLRRPKGSSRLVSLYLLPPDQPDLLMAETAFVGQFMLYGRRAFDLTRMLDNFYASQHEDGFISRELDPDSGENVCCPYDPNSTGPAIMAWAEWRRYRATGDDGRFAEVFWPLMAHHRWRRRHRSWPDGTYWATGIGSGLDNQPRVPDSMSYHQHWSWVDATMQAALDGRLLAQMASQLGQTDLAAELAQERTALIQLINERMWNEETGFYHDVAPDGRFSPVKSIAAYWGLADAELIPEKRRETFVRHLREVWAFKLPHRIPSLSADSDGYNSQTGHGWRGGVWPSANYVVLKGLRAIGQHKLAHAIAVNHVAKVCDVFRHTDTFWQHYAPESVAPGEGAASNAVGATGLTPIAMLLEDVIGISVDWPQRRVTWDRRLQAAGRYGARRLPVGDSGTMDLLGDETKIVVTTDVPCTLEIRDAEQSLQTAVPSGTTEIAL